ncbi:hypothetical protein FGO68_gene4038 [Halteria grandinella]|uniref:Uncharacterized protein n=1 Tax=Halteria grandinella TaxID=5974 RepID=A0A8J8P279_HALGN|nr:hypothetical protein FGO68_gene4038 [Halteria grandinella]
MNTSFQDNFNQCPSPLRELSTVNITSGKYLQTASEEQVSEWIVFGFSIASFALILIIVLYELLYPLYMRREWREKTLIEYTKRYNREEYDKIRPDLKRREIVKNPVYVLPTMGDIRKSIGAKFNGMFKPNAYTPVQNTGAADSRNNNPFTQKYTTLANEATIEIPQQQPIPPKPTVTKAESIGFEELIEPPGSYQNQQKAKQAAAQRKMGKTETSPGPAPLKDLNDKKGQFASTQRPIDEDMDDEAYMETFVKRKRKV